MNSAGLGHKADWPSYGPSGRTRVRLPLRANWAAALPVLSAGWDPEAMDDWSLLLPQPQGFEGFLSAAVQPKLHGLAIPNPP